LKKKSIVILTARVRARRESQGEIEHQVKRTQRS
jgi:hypothetical protein